MNAGWLLGKWHRLTKSSLVCPVSARMLSGHHPAFILPPQPSKDATLELIAYAELLTGRLSGPWKAPRTKLCSPASLPHPVPQSQQALWTVQCSRSDSVQCRGNSPPLHILKTISSEQRLVLSSEMMVSLRSSGKATFSPYSAEFIQPLQRTPG